MFYTLSCTSAALMPLEAFWQFSLAVVPFTEQQRAFVADLYRANNGVKYKNTSGTVNPFFIGIFSGVSFLYLSNFINMLNVNWSK